MPSIVPDPFHKSASSEKKKRPFRRCAVRALKNDVADGDRAILAFTLLSAMQTAFLGGQTAGMLLGFDLTVPEGRAAYVTKLVNMLFEGARSL